MESPLSALRNQQTGNIYLGLVPPTLFRTLGGKPSLFGSSGRRLELHGLSG